MADQLPVATNYAQHETLSLEMPDKGALVVIYDQISKGGALVPLRNDPVNYNNDICLVSAVLNRMKTDDINMSSVKVTIISNDLHLKDLINSNLEKYRNSNHEQNNIKTDSMHNNGPVITLNLKNGSFIQQQKQIQQDLELQ